MLVLINCIYVQRFTGTSKLVVYDVKSVISRSGL